MIESLYTGQGTDFYLTTPTVADTVNLAIALNRPLLVEGEPGCGKTMLAYSIAAELGLDEPVKIVVRSTSRAQDLLYRVDALRRLQDAQNPLLETARHIYPYLSLGSLGRALHEPVRRVVLLDEIDKADIDFPNDLLNVLDTFSFDIDDLPEEEEKQALAAHGFGRHVKSDVPSRPVIVITSNREKRLPDPFLRRCLYIRLLFPTEAGELRRIVEKNIKEPLAGQNAGLMQTAVETFLGIRETALLNDVNKAPTTSELIDWVKILYWKGKTPASLKEKPYLPPYWELLFKDMNDLDLYRAVAQAREKEAPAPAG